MVCSVFQQLESIDKGLGSHFEATVPFDLLKLDCTGDDHFLRDNISVITRSVSLIGPSA